jgi:hypothetical protein
MAMIMIKKRTETKIIMDEINSNLQLKANLYLLTGNTIEGPCLILYVSIEVSPEFDKEESILWTLIIKFLQPTLFLREFVIDLPYIHSLYIKERNQQAITRISSLPNYYICNVHLVKN